MATKSTKKKATAKKAASKKPGKKKSAQNHVSHIEPPRKEFEYAVLKMDYVTKDGGFWRQVVVPLGYNLDELHLIIQAAFNWYAYHGYEFQQGKQHYTSEPLVIDFPVFTDNPKLPDKLMCETKVSDLFKNIGDEAMYFYDFGDYNRVKITCVKFTEELWKRDFATNGQDAVEDSGGVGFIPGIVKLLTQEPLAEEARNCREWLMTAFEMSPEEALHIPTVHEIFTRVLIVLHSLQ